MLTGLIIGFIAGIFMGFLITALLKVSAFEDERYEYMKIIKELRDKLAEKD